MGNRSVKGLQIYGVFFLMALKFMEDSVMCFDGDLLGCMQNIV